MSIKTTKWRDETRELFLNRPASLTVAKIAEDLEVSISWLNSFGRGDIDNPTVLATEALNSYLKAHAKKASA